MKLSATEKRIYALAQKWANKPLPSKRDPLYPCAVRQRTCGRWLLKEFKEPAEEPRETFQLSNEGSFLDLGGYF